MIPMTIGNTKLTITIVSGVTIYLFVKFVIHDPMTAFTVLGQQNK